MVVIPPDREIQLLIDYTIWTNQIIVAELIAPTLGGQTLQLGIKPNHSLNFFMAKIGGSDNWRIIAEQGDKFVSSSGDFHKLKCFIIWRPRRQYLFRKTLACKKIAKVATSRWPTVKEIRQGLVRRTPTDHLKIMKPFNLHNFIFLLTVQFNTI